MYPRKPLIQDGDAQLDRQPVQKEPTVPLQKSARSLRLMRQRPRAAMSRYTVAEQNSYLRSRLTIQLGLPGMPKDASHLLWTGVHS